jgi:hypothetical protein
MDLTIDILVTDCNDFMTTEQTVPKLEAEAYFWD